MISTILKVDKKGRDLEMEDTQLYVKQNREAVVDIPEVEDVKITPGTLIRLGVYLVAFLNFIFVTFFGSEVFAGVGTDNIEGIVLVGYEIVTYGGALFALLSGLWKDNDITKKAIVRKNVGKQVVDK